MLFLVTICLFGSLVASISGDGAGIAEESSSNKVSTTALDTSDLSSTSVDLVTNLLNAVQSNPGAVKLLLYLVKVLSKNPVDLILNVAIPLLNPRSLIPEMFLVDQTISNPVSTIQNFLIPIIKRSTAVTLTNILQLIKKFPTFSLVIVLPLILIPTTNSFIRTILENIFRGPFAISKPINYLLEKAVSNPIIFMKQLVLPFFSSPAIKFVSFLIEQASRNVRDFVTNVIIPSFNPNSSKPLKFIFEAAIENPKPFVTGFILQLLIPATANALASALQSLVSNPDQIVPNLLLSIFAFIVLIIEALP